MKNLNLICLSLIVITTSCSNTNSKDAPSSAEHTSGIWGYIDYGIEEKTIDSCQYIIIFGSHGRDIIHKSNCKNKFHAIKP